MSLFDGGMPLKLTKPVRLIELFAGIGAQAKALEILGVDFERYRIYYVKVDEENEETEESETEALTQNM